MVGGGGGAAVYYLTDYDERSRYEIRAYIGLKNRQIINETYSFRCFLIL